MGSEDTKKRPSYHRASINIDRTQKTRLQPVQEILLKKDISIKEFAEVLGLSRSGLARRFAQDNCTLIDMEEMAEALGYEFRWTITRKKNK